MTVRRLTLGRVAGVYGVRGWVKLLSFTRPIENLLDYRDVWIAHGAGFKSRIAEGKAHTGGLIGRLAGADGKLIEDRDVAASLIGSEIQVERSQMPEPEDGEIYWFDLIGLMVRNVEGVALGKVSEMTSNGAQDVLVVQDGETERLIPFVHGPIIQSVSLADGLIVADWQPDF
jgi:16S rRNA processing protein RimM